MTAVRLLQHYERIADSPGAMARMRRFILDLAVRGKLVPQDANEEPASNLLKRMGEERARCAKEGLLHKSALNGVERRSLYELPPTWEWACLGDVARYGIANKVNSNSQISRDTWVLDLEDIEKDTSRLVERMTSAKRPFQSTKTVFKRGDVLFGKLRPYLNKVLVADADGVCSTEIVPIRGYCEMFAEYIRLVLTSPITMAAVNRLMYGMKMPRLGPKDALSLAFPLPPAAEQRRIVAKMDEVMKLCDQLDIARGNRESCRAQLTIASFRRLGIETSSFREDCGFVLDLLPVLTTRASHVGQLRNVILNLAVRGKLVPQQTGGETGYDLLQRISAEKAKLEAEGNLKRDKEVWDGLPKKPPFQIPANWTWTSLQDVFEISRGGSPRPAGDPRFFGGPIPWVTVGEITKDRQKYLVSTESGLTDEGAARSRYINSGDLLLTNSGATLGVPKVSKIKACINDGVAVLRLFHSVPLNDFAYLYLHAQTAAFRSVKQGMGQPNLNTPIIAGWFFPLPPVLEQRRIVAKIDELNLLCDRLEESINNKAAMSSRLLEALLLEALKAPRFAGDGNGTEALVKGDDFAVRQRAA